MATALKLENPHIASLPVEDPDLVLYALYDGLPLVAARPDRIIILNMGFFTSNQSQQIDLTKLVDVLQFLGEETKITRLSGPGSDATSGATFAGQNYDSGWPSGNKFIERAGGIVAVRSSEAIIVERC